MDDRPTLDDDILDKIASLAQIHPDNQDGFRRCVRAIIGELWRGMAVQQAPVRRTPIMEELAAYKKAIKEVRELLAIDAGNQKPASYHAKIAMLAELSSMKQHGLADFLDGGLSLLDDLDLSIEKARPRVEKAYQAKGNSHGAQGGRIAIDHFLYELLFVIRRQGGDIATSRTMKSSPAHLSKALDILQPYLPSSFPSEMGWTCESVGSRVNRDLANMPTGK